MGRLQFDDFGFHHLAAPGHGIGVAPGVRVLALREGRLRDQRPDAGLVGRLGERGQLVIDHGQLLTSALEPLGNIHQPALDQGSGHGFRRLPEQPAITRHIVPKGLPSDFSAFSSGSVTLKGMRVLVVDDEPAVRQALDRALRFEGYQTESAEDGPSALAAHAERPADAIVLDVAMPRMDGLEVCRRLRQAGDHTPVLMLTARAAVNDRVAGLDAGADDYLVKPFALEELLARIRALLRRSAPAGDGEVLRFADLSLDPGTREVRRGGRSMELTRTEFLLLELLLRNARQVLPRELIFDRVWGYDFGANSNSLEVYIGYLRRKTEAGGEPRLIHTVRGVGYVLRQPTEGAGP